MEAKRKKVFITVLAAAAAAAVFAAALGVPAPRGEPQSGTCLRGAGVRYDGEAPLRACRTGIAVLWNPGGLGNQSEPGSAGKGDPGI